MEQKTEKTFVIDLGEIASLIILSLFIVWFLANPPKVNVIHIAPPDAESSCEPEEEEQPELQSVNTVNL